MDAMLNIDAIYKLKASLQPLLQGTAENVTADRSVPVECIIHLGDRLSNPAITFDVNVPGTDPETQSRGRQCADSTPETVDTQFALPAAVQQLHVREHIAGLVEHRQRRFRPRQGLEFVSNMVSNLAFERTTTTWSSATAPSRN